MNTDIDFSKIVLTEDELEALEDLHKHGRKPISKAFALYNSLKSLDFVTYLSDRNSDTLYAAITDTGVRYLLYRKEREEKERKETIRYRITTGIAIAALILSLVALLWQGYTWFYKVNEISSSSDTAIVSQKMSANP